MRSLPEMSPDIERADAVQSEDAASIDIDLSFMDIYVHHGIHNPLHLMASKARIMCLGYRPFGDCFEKKSHQHV